MKTSIIKFLIPCIFLLNACNKCEETTKSPSRVDQSDIPILFPYNGKEKIKFLRNSTDTIIFYNLGINTTYNYTNTQADCPVKIPLEQKNMQFIDSVYGNNIQLINYVNSADNDQFAIVVNNAIIVEKPAINFIAKQPPIKSITILGKQYDSISTWNNIFKDSVTYKTLRYGVLRFTSNKNIFELIP
jgi:hypothetical protein